MGYGMYLISNQPLQMLTCYSRQQNYLLKSDSDSLATRLFLQRLSCSINVTKYRLTLAARGIHRHNVVTFIFVCSIAFRTAGMTKSYLLNGRLQTFKLEWQRGTRRGRSSSPSLTPWSSPTCSDVLPVVLVGLHFDCLSMHRTR